MNRTDFQRLSELRLEESKSLLAAGFPDGAYYLAGYAIECALKACIAKRTQEHDFPEKGSHRWFTHGLEELFAFAELKVELELSLRANRGMNAKWATVKNWSEESRYETGKTNRDAEDLLAAIEDQPGGLLPWLRQRW
ncbi:MAG: HEPN domain-containing protein [Terracidiphilus sp.]